jgi:hypothetical protein
MFLFLIIQTKFYNGKLLNMHMQMNTHMKTNVKICTHNSIQSLHSTCGVDKAMHSAYRNSARIREHL